VGQALQVLEQAFVAPCVKYLQVTVLLLEGAVEVGQLTVPQHLEQVSSLEQKRLRESPR
jgi:hypothetical protein